MSLEKVPFFYELLEKQYSKEIVEKIIQGFNKKRKTTLRVNTLKTDVETIKKTLKENNIEFEETTWSKEALILKNCAESNIEKLNIYEEGKIYMQSLSSMLPPIILEPKEKESILDMAAAPGGKTTQIAALTENMAQITACEMNNIRAERLKFNIEKQGAKSIYVMVTDSRRLDNFFSFDKILLDAPCSGSGTLNLQDKNLEKYFTMKLIDKSASNQYTLLKKALKILKSGKEMVYSTCSILAKENEEIIERVLKEEKAEIVEINFNGMESIPLLPTKINGTICVMPNELYEGFFVAKIRKK